MSTNFTVIYKNFPSFQVSSVRKKGKSQRILTLDRTDEIVSGDVLMFKQDAIDKVYDEMIICVKLYDNFNILVEGTNKKINKFAGSLKGELLKVGNISKDA